jgi:hypothetical protein
MATNATVPMFAPDGTTTGEIPQSKVQDALKAGFKPAYEMTSPDGKVGYIPQERANDAVKAGFKLGAPDQPDHPVNRFWEALTNPVGSGGRSQGLLGGALQVGGQAIKAMAAPFTNPGDTLKGIAKSAVAIGTGNPYEVGASMAPSPDQVAADKQQGGTALAAENVAGQTLGAIEGSRALGGAAKVAQPYAAAATDAVAGKVVPSVMKERAGGLLQSVAHDANKIPVQLDNAGDAALKLMDWQRKTNLGPTVNKFLNRITNPKAGPLTYEEARDFYQVLGSLSADETMKMAPPVRRQLVQMVVGLKQDIGNAADQVGHAADYYKGLNDYHTAAKLQEWYDAAKKYAIPAALGAAGMAGAGKLLNVYNSVNR